MAMNSVLIRIAAASAAISLLAAVRIPGFEDYLVREIYGGPAAKPRLGTRTQHEFENQIRNQAQSPPNFAGAYKIVEWGCGSSCVSIALIDLRTGDVSDGPFRILGYGRRLRYEGGADELEYRPSSSLLIARGCPDDRACGTYYFELAGSRFALLRYAPARAVTPGAHLFGTLQGRDRNYPGAVVCMEGPRGTHCSTANSRGEYDLVVEPGRYNAEVRLDGQLLWAQRVEVSRAGDYRGLIKP
jgi:hypothetical protein